MPKANEKQTFTIWKGLPNEVELSEDTCDLFWRANQSDKRGSLIARREILALGLEETLDTVESRGEYETTRAIWKRTAALLHPDRPDGDAVKAARLNELWTIVQKLRGWNRNGGEHQLWAN